MAVRGDSTAIASRDGLAKIWNIAPSWDAKRWWNIVGKSYDPPRAVFNDGVGGQSIATMRDKMMADQDHRVLTTVIYDRRNAGETPETYVSDLATALSSLRTRQFLIMPQVPRSSDFPEDAEQTKAMQAIDKEVMARWSANTFSADERREFLNALAAGETRMDGLHRNERGQAIEAEFIGNWLRKRGW